ncbi:unnamed protein product [Cutaneotrichosporon oleaginosum]
MSRAISCLRPALLARTRPLSLSIARPHPHPGTGARTPLVAPARTFLFGRSPLNTGDKDLLDNPDRRPSKLTPRPEDSYWSWLGRATIVGVGSIVTLALFVYLLWVTDSFWGIAKGRRFVANDQNKWAEDERTGDE